MSEQHETNHQPPKSAGAEEGESNGVGRRAVLMAAGLGAGAVVANATGASAQTGTSLGAEPVLGKSSAVVTRQQRETLVNLARTDPKFRDLLKSDWPGALKQAGIDPAAVKGKILKDTETIPFAGGPATTGIEISIEIRASANEEKINVNDIVLFDQSKT